MTTPADTPELAAARAELAQIVDDLNSRPELMDLEDVRDAIALAQRGQTLLAALAEETPR